MFRRKWEVVCDVTYHVPGPPDKIGDGTNGFKRFFKRSAEAQAKRMNGHQAMSNALLRDVFTIRWYARERNGDNS